MQYRPLRYLILTTSFHLLKPESSSNLIGRVMGLHSWTILRSHINRLS